MSENEPTSIRAGDSASWRKVLDAFPASAGWALKYRIVPRLGGTALDFAASAEGDDFVVSLSASATQSWAAGECTLVGYVERGAGSSLERTTVHTSSITIHANLIEASAIDGRSVAQQIVEAIDAWLTTKAGWAGEKVHADRRIKDHPLPDLIKLRDYYAAQLRAEQSAQALASGLGLGGVSRIMVRM